MAGEWRRAADLWAKIGCPYEAALALAESHEEDALRRALEIFDRLGARPAAGMTARRLREMGVRRIPRGPRPTTRAHPAGLTARELEIVPLLVQGLSNAEIARRIYVSSKTVDHHISSILSKLGARRRGEVAREAARLGLMPDGVAVGTQG
jgi:DNA-binding NarL/FixJ family response regulator